MNIYNHIFQSAEKKKKLLSVLIDPDKINDHDCEKIVLKGNDCQVDFFFVGSSILTQNNFESCIEVLKKNTKIPIVIFPGNSMQISSKADAILLLSLISGRNADLLIGQHVLAAPNLKRSNIEIISTGYMLVDSGRPTAATYMSHTAPVPHDKPEIALCTAMAGEMLGMKIIYLDAGSGAKNTVSIEMIEKVKQGINIPLIVGGGIRNGEKAFELCKAGADMIVVGNALESDISLLSEISSAVKEVRVKSKD